MVIVKTFQRSVQVARAAKGGETQNSGPCQTKKKQKGSKNFFQKLRPKKHKKFLRMYSEANEMFTIAAEAAYKAKSVFDKYKAPFSDICRRGLRISICYTLPP